MVRSGTMMRIERADDASEGNRARLLEGFSASVAEKGYAATTIADIVRLARVSKRTFYEHFADKDACFLASYRAASDEMLAAIASAVDPTAPWETQMRVAMRAYLAALEENPALTRTFLLEIHAAGPAALEARRGIHQRFAELLRALTGAARKTNPELGTLSRAMATALVGGINELVLAALAGDLQLRTVEKTATALVHAVLLAPR